MENNEQGVAPRSKTVQAIHMENIDAVTFIPIQAVVIMISPVAAVRGRSFSFSPSSMKRPAFGDDDFYFIAVLIAGGSRAE